MIDREKFIELRRSGIGGTDSAAICRVNPYKCPLEVYNDKLGLSTEDSDNIHMWLGRSLEESLIERYESEYGYDVQTPETIRHPTYDYLIANVDGIVSDSHVVEIKTSSAYDQWGEERSEMALMTDVPIAYYYQIQHYLMVTGLEEAHIYVFLHGYKMETRLYRFARNNLFIAKMRTKVMDFWINNVLKEIPPVAMTREEVLLLHPKPKEKKLVEASELDLSNVNELHKIKSDLDSLKKKYKAGIDALASSCQDAEGITTDSGPIFTFKQTKRGTRVARLHN